MKRPAAATAGKLGQQWSETYAELSAWLEMPEHKDRYPHQSAGPGSKELSLAKWVNNQRNNYRNEGLSEEGMWQK